MATLPGRMLALLLLTVACSARGGTVLVIEVDGPPQLRTSAVEVDVTVASGRRRAFVFGVPDRGWFLLPVRLGIGIGEGELGDASVAIEVRDEGSGALYCAAAGATLRARRVETVQVEVVACAAGAPDAGAPDAGAPDAGAPDAPVPPRDRWAPVATEGAPPARSQHVAVWTGREMIVWGGTDGALGLADGARYDPAADRWVALSRDGAPEGRFLHAAAWTGSELVVWGGQAAAQGGVLASGAGYDAASDKWRRITSLLAPRAEATAVWTGSELVVWGGRDAAGQPVADGARFDGRDGWRLIAAPAFGLRRSAAPGVWSAGAVLIWGGLGEGDPRQVVATGLRWDPRGDAWTLLDEAPLGPRFGHTLVDAGGAAIVWGGWDGRTQVGDGARYDPVARRWDPLPGAGAPSRRSEHTAVWTGSELIVWGGFDGQVLGSGARLEPGSDTWRALPERGAPPARTGHTAVWTGSELIVWGGSGASGPLADGGRYTP